MKSTAGSSDTSGPYRTGILVSLLSLLLESLILFQPPRNSAPPAMSVVAPTLTPAPTKTPWPWGGLAGVAESVAPGTYDLSCLWQSRYCAKTGALTRIYRWRNNIAGGLIDTYWMRFSGNCFSNYEAWCRGCPADCSTPCSNGVVRCIDCTTCTRWQGGSSTGTSGNIVMHVSQVDYSTWVLAAWEPPFALVMFDIEGRPCEDPPDRGYCP